MGWFNWPSPPPPGGPPGPPGFSPHDYWRSPYPNFAALPVVDNEIGDVRQALDTRLGWTWDGAIWQPFTGSGGSTFWQDPVANFAALPLVGNVVGDVRQTLDNQQIWTWNGVAWVPVGTVTTGNQTYAVVPYDPTVPLWAGAPDPPAVYLDATGTAQLATASAALTKAHGFAYDYDVDAPGFCKMITDGPLGGFGNTLVLVAGQDYALDIPVGGYVVAGAGVPVAPGTIAQWLGSAESPTSMVVDVDSSILIN